jgi:hypothetical protein
MTLSLSRSSGASSARVFLFRLPTLLVTLHVLLMLVTGFVWISSSHQMDKILSLPATRLPVEVE